MDYAASIAPHVDSLFTDLFLPQLVMCLFPCCVNTNGIFEQILLNSEVVYSFFSMMIIILAVSVACNDTLFLEMLHMFVTYPFGYSFCIQLLTNVGWLNWCMHLMLALLFLSVHWHVSHWISSFSLLMDRFCHVMIIIISVHIAYL